MLCRREQYLHLIGDLHSLVICPFLMQLKHLFESLRCSILSLSFFFLNILQSRSRCVVEHSFPFHSQGDIIVAKSRLPMCSATLFIWSIMSRGVSSYIANGSPERVLTKGTLDILVFVPSSLFTQETGAYKKGHLISVISNAFVLLVNCLLVLLVT
jgi:hypothetical protein